MRKIALASLALGLVAVSNVSEAQRASRMAFSPSTANAAPVRRAAANKPTITLLGGVATADSPFDMGFMVGASLKWDLSGAPVDLRFDPSIARHGGGVLGVDVSVLFVNLPVAVEYAFKTTGGSGEPYVFGGLGLHYGKYDVDIPSVPGYGGYGDSSTDLGLTIGGGYRLKSGLSFEARYLDINGFTTIPLLVGWRI